MKKRILFRTDGNTETGLGHLYRCFALAEIYKHDFDFSFITQSNSTLSIFPKNYHTITLPSSITQKEEAVWISNNFSHDKHIIILDGYQFDYTYQKQLKANNYYLICIDDLNSGHQVADVIINHSLLIKKEDYKAEQYTKFALGTSYAILRPSFLNATKQKRSINKVDSCFVCFGGADYNDLTLKAVLALLEIDEINTIYAVVGAAYQNQEIFELEKHHERLSVHQNISEHDLCQIMKNSNMAIASTSTISYEICAVKIPLIGGYYVKNQIAIYKGLLNNEAIFDGGDFENNSVNDFKKLILQFINENNSNFYIEKQSILFDDKINSRFLKLLN